MLQVIDRMAYNLWSNLDIPVVWGNSSLKNSLEGKRVKVGSQQVQRTYSSTVCKLIIKIILERIRAWYETQLSKKQSRFRTNRGTTDAIYSMKRIQQIQNRKKQPLYLLFVDLIVKFDRIPRKWLLDSIKHRFLEDESVICSIYRENSNRKHL